MSNYLLAITATSKETQISERDKGDLPETKQTITDETRHVYQSVSGSAAVTNDHPFLVYNRG